MNIKRIGAVCAMLTALCGCAAGAPLDYLPYMDVWPANYSEEYIHDINFETEAGKQIALTTIDVKPFSKGGQGSPACCAGLPGVGRTLRVIWRTGGNYDTPKSDWVTRSGTAKIKGIASNDPDSNTSLILRFFPNNQIEAEYVAQPLKSGTPLDPRVDLLFTGQRVMRHMGE